MPRRSSGAAALTLPLPFVDAYETPEQREWLAAQFDGLTDELRSVTPSEWAEQNRYLPPSGAAMPGPYRFAVAPYVKEIVDCLAVDSPVRELSWMKGVQICATTGVLENFLGYIIAEVQTDPVMLITADGELAKHRMDSSITPMLQLSGLDALIKSADEKNTRKKGKTDRKIEWFGGGFLIPYGAKNAAKLRSIPIRFLLRDEIDAWPTTVGKDGDPLQLSSDRTAGFESNRKIVDISTPLYKGQSKIEQRFLRGDQRYYFVRCLKCNHAQVLRWRRENQQTGQITGITWELQNGILVPDSVRYLCEECGHPHVNEDKTRLLAPEHGAEWRPTAEPADPNHRSYHLSALYSPVGMQTWAACVHKWLEAWDVERNRMRDLGKLQVFYNNVLGEPFEMKGDRVRFDSVSSHKRSAYHFGQIPNKWAEQYCGGPAHLLVCTVDVHKDHLPVAVWAWCRGRRAILVDYWRFEGDPEQSDDAATWGKLQELIEQKRYTADDGKRYSVMLTLIDSGYLADQVYRFCANYSGGVYPVKGREAPPRATLKEFSSFETPNGVTGYSVVVDFYKDRWSASLRREWDGLGVQPEGHFNAPIDTTDAQLKELTVETKKPRMSKDGGFEWIRPSGAPNELWDLLVYGNLALDLVCWNWSETKKYPFTNWAAFYDECDRGMFFQK